MKCSFKAFWYQKSKPNLSQIVYQNALIKTNVKSIKTSFEFPTNTNKFNLLFIIVNMGLKIYDYKHKSNSDLVWHGGKAKNLPTLHFLDEVAAN